MESLVRKEMSPRVSAEQQTSGDLVKRIRKLRWIGMGSEAEALQATITNDPQVASRRHTAAPQTMPSAEPMRTRKEKIEQNIAELIAAFPLAFSTEPERIKPLSIGIKQRIYARCNLSHREIGAALRRYTGRVAYLYALIEGAVRVDLDGKGNGSVTVKEATYAAEQIMKILARAAGTTTSKIKRNAPVQESNPQRPAIPDPSKSGPRRIGLVGLKHASATRRVPRGTVDARRFDGLHDHQPDEHTRMNGNSSSHQQVSH
jgi:sRNA-binding protein